MKKSIGCFLFNQALFKITILVKLLGEYCFPVIFLLNCIQYVVTLESQTIDDFGYSLNLSWDDLEQLRTVFVSVEQGDLGILSSLGIKVGK